MQHIRDNEMEQEATRNSFGGVFFQVEDYLDRGTGQYGMESMAKNIWTTSTLFYGWYWKYKAQF